MRFESLPQAAGTLLRVLPVLLLPLLASPSHAQKLSLAAFYGVWKGSAISENEQSVYFHVTQRDIGVTIEPLDDNRFKLVSATIQRKKGTPDNPREKLKTTETTFVKGDGDIWWAEDSGDPKAGGVLRWARLDDNALIVNSFAIREDGRSELQAHKRAITDRGMELTFTLTLDGDAIRSVEGQLVRVQ